MFIEYCSYHKASYICNIPKEFLKRFPPKIVWLTLEINETVIENIFQSATMTNKQNTFIFIKAGPYDSTSDDLFSEIFRYIIVRQLINPS